MITAERYHDFSCGHRVVGHESKCAMLHGHNYRITFTVTAKLDAVGRVMDFSVIKEKLCNWLEEHWDHKLLLWYDDNAFHTLMNFVEDREVGAVRDILEASIVWVPFNPTAENMAQYLLDVIGPLQLEGTNVKLVAVRVEETRKCSATARATIFSILDDAPTRPPNYNPNPLPC